MLEYMAKYCDSIRCDSDGVYVAVLKPEYAVDGLRVIKCDNVTGDVRNDRWVTINGAHVLIGRDGRIAGGMGGKLNGKKFGAWFGLGKHRAMQLPKSFGTGRASKMMERDVNGNYVKVKGKKVALKAPKGALRSRELPPKMRTTINALNRERAGKRFTQGFRNNIIDAFENAPKGTQIRVGAKLVERTDRGWTYKGKEVSVNTMSNMAMMGEHIYVEKYPKRQKFEFDKTPPKQETGAYNPNKLVDIRTKGDSYENFHAPADSLMTNTKNWKNPPTVAQLLRRRKAIKAAKEFANTENYEAVSNNRTAKGKQMNRQLEYFIDHSPRHTGTIHRAVDVSATEFGKYQKLIEKSSAFGTNSVTSWSSNPQTTGGANADKPYKIIFTKKDGFRKSASVNDFAATQSDGEVIVSKSTSMRVKRVLMAGPGYMQVEVEEV